MGRLCCADEFVMSQKPTQHAHFSLELGAVRPGRFPYLAANRSTTYSELDLRNYSNEIREHVGRWKYPITPTEPSVPPLQRRSESEFQSGTNPTKRRLLL